VAGECVILVGLPAAGKTTFYQQRFAGTHVHISKDLWPKSADKGARQARELSAALSAGHPVVVDNTSPTPADRASIIALAHEHGARVIGYHFTSTPRESLGRNRGREGKARVPDVAIFATAKRLTPPVKDEGFDELYSVSVAGEGTFEVQAM
jgi:predicted kinase